MPLTFGPEAPADDERVIAKGYMHWISLVYFAAPAVAAYLGDIKLVLWVSATTIIILLNEANGRLHDLCIRLRRANIRLSQIQDEQRRLKG